MKCEVEEEEEEEVGKRACACVVRARAALKKQTPAKGMTCSHIYTQHPTPPQKKRRGGREKCLDLDR
jgi:hypothetical protein